jgi:hypothetical protein
MNLYGRQGDLVIENISNVDGDLIAVTDHVISGDSSGHPHMIRGRSKIRKDGELTFVVLTKAAELIHGKPDGHKTVKLKAGAYEIHPLRERGGAGDRAIQD